MCCRTTVVMYAWVSICYHKISYLPALFMSKTRCCRILDSVLSWVSLKMLCSIILVSFAGHRHLPHSLQNFRWTRDSNGLFSNSKGTCMVSDRSNEMTGSSLIMAHWHISLFSVHAINCWHSTAVHMLYMAHWYYWHIAQSCAMCILVMTPDSG